MKIFLVSIGCFMFAATLLPFLRRDEWWIRSFDFPRIQIVFITAVTLILYLLTVSGYETADFAFITGLGLCLIYQCYMIYPYTILSAKQVQQSRSLRKESGFSLLTANVLMDNREAVKLKGIIKKADPDIILAVETNEWWQEQLREFDDTHPYSVKQPQDNKYGMILYSRYELLDPEVKFLVQNDIPSIHTRVRLPAGVEVELRCLHPRPPFITGDETSTERDAEILIVGKETRDIDAPVVVLGDMNDVAWSRTNYLFQDISGLLDPRVGRGFYNTFHAGYPFIRFPLDHFFHTKTFRLVDFRRLDYFGSDHFPVFMELSYEPDAEKQQEEPVPEPSEETEADDKIEKGA